MDYSCTFFSTFRMRLTSFSSFKRVIRSNAAHTFLRINPPVRSTIMRWLSMSASGSRSAMYFALIYDTLRSPRKSRGMHSNLNCSDSQKCFVLQPMIRSSVELSVHRNEYTVGIAFASSLERSKSIPRKLFANPRVKPRMEIF
jgi:hypothetical protein